MRPSAVRAAPGRSSAGHGSGVAQLQSSAGNRAVAKLMSSDARAGDVDTIDAIAAGGNRAALGLLHVQRDDKKPDPTTASQPGAKPDAKPDAKAPAGPDAKSLRKAWADAGLVAGGPLFDLINDDLSLAKLLDMGLPELGGLATKGTSAAFDKATEAGGSKGEVKPIGLDTKEAGQIGGALAGWAAGAVQKWLKTDDGKKFLAKAQAKINEHPTAAYWTIVSTLAVAIGGAVTGYFMGAFDPPEFKKQFEIRGVKIDAAVDLGNFKERVLQSGKLAMATKAGPGTLGVEGTAKSVTDEKTKAQGYDLGVTGSYTLGDEKKGGSAKLSGGVGYSTLKDQASANLGASFKFKPLTVDTTWKFLGDGTGVLDTTAVAKVNEQYSIGAGASGGVYGPGETKSPLGFKLSLTSTQGKDTDKVTADVNPNSRIVTFGREATRTLWGGSLAASESHGTEGKSVGAAYVRDALKLDLKYVVDKAGAQTLESGASTKGEGFEAAFAAKFGLDEGELQKLTVHLGFTTPDETVSFLHDLTIAVAAGKMETKATETIKIRLKQIAVELKANVGEAGGKELASGVSGELGWKLPSGLILGAGAGASYTPGKEGTNVPWIVGPTVSVGHEALPVRLIGGVNVPVGAGSENMPPVFGLSIGGAFEFGKDKKKK
jgi:hypothetical protein